MVLIDRVLAEADKETPDLSVLTTEPVAKTESSGYGWREDPINKRAKFHHGTDYRGKRGTPVLAAGNGTVTFAGRRGGYGRVVFIDHGNGVITRYAHLNRIDVKVGDTLTAGQQLGQLGASGRTTGAHLHFEVRLTGRSVDPNTAMIVADIMRENPAAGRLAAYALAPELQEYSQDSESKAVRIPTRPERAARTKRQQVLW
jgi:murein DD-endopeptidase MepM/ murein hydrolase activator NlpD